MFIHIRQIGAPPGQFQTMYYFAPNEQRNTNLAGNKREINTLFIKPLLWPLSEQNISKQKVGHKNT